MFVGLTIVPGRSDRGVSDVIYRIAAARPFFQSMARRGRFPQISLTFAAAFAIIECVGMHLDASPCAPSTRHGVC